MRKRLFYDIETSFNVGIFWRTGYNLTINPGDIIHERAIICICYKWEGEDEIHSYATLQHNYAVQHGGEKYECRECGSTNYVYNKKVVTAAGTVHHWLRCRDCNNNFLI